MLAIFPIGDVPDGVSTVAWQPDFVNLDGIQRLTHHRLDGIPPRERPIPPLPSPQLLHAAERSLSRFTYPATLTMSALVLCTIAKSSCLFRAAGTLNLSSVS